MCIADLRNFYTLTVFNLCQQRQKEKRHWLPSYMGDVSAPGIGVALVM